MPYARLRHAEPRRHLGAGSVALGKIARCILWPHRCVRMSTGSTQRKACASCWWSAGMRSAGMRSAGMAPMGGGLDTLNYFIYAFQLPLFLLVGGLFVPRQVEAIPIILAGLVRRLVAPISCGASSNSASIHLACNAVNTPTPLDARA